jgi:hypothetical protein
VAVTFNLYVFILHNISIYLQILTNVYVSQDYHNRWPLLIKNVKLLTFIMETQCVSFGKEVVKCYYKKTFQL